MVNEVIVPRGTPSVAIVSGAGAWVGPMMKLPSASGGGSVPSGSSFAVTYPAVCGSRVGGVGRGGATAAGAPGAGAAGAAGGFCACDAARLVTRQREQAIVSRMNDPRIGALAPGVA